RNDLRPQAGAVLHHLHALSRNKPVSHVSSLLRNPAYHHSFLAVPATVKKKEGLSCSGSRLKSAVLAFDTGFGSN
ncbi:TPA: hypothetical protein ACJJ1H_005028, partial [Enterobacter kobei]